MAHRARRPAAALLAAFAILVAGCRAEGRTSITVRTDGSGELAVSMAVDTQTDDTFRSITGQSFAAAVTLSDVARAGWQVARLDSPGGSSITVSRHFDSPADLGAALRAIAGTDPAVVPSANLTMNRSLLSRHYAFASTVDLTGGLLTGAIASALGPESAERLKARFGFDPSRDLSMSVELVLPGKYGATNADRVDGSRAVWTIGGGQRRDLTAESTYFEIAYVAAAAGGAAALVALVALLVADSVRRRRRRPAG